MLSALTDESHISYFLLYDHNGSKYCVTISAILAIIDKRDRSFSKASSHRPPKLLPSSWALPLFA